MFSGAIGGAIGTGLFWVPDKTIAMTGPSILLMCYRVHVIYVHAWIGRNYYSNTNFKSFADVTNTYIGPFAGFVTGWTYWLCWIITGMAEVTAVAKYISFGSQTYLVD